MDQIFADGVAPMLPPVFGWIALIKHVPVALPKAQTVWVIERTLRAYEMIDGAKRIAALSLPRLGKPQHEWIGFKLLLLLGQCFGKSKFRNGGDVGRLVRLAI